MSNNNSFGISEILNMFEPSLDTSDLIEAKLMSSVAVAITKERLRLKMNQSEFARHLGVQQSLVSRWEQGDYNFTVRKISEIMAKLNIDVDIIFSNTETMDSIRHISRPGLSKRNNVYSFNENKKNKLKGKSYMGGGWKSAAVH